ncbi:Gamma-glutamyl cyclotransferase [Planctomycetales bacterium 10988]|nr:Gamma-glutamyl cyclotransferase [Planctomycetales bacterium 10988]
MANAPVQIFVYGTLKRGYRNFARCCRTVQAVQPAKVRGQLFQLPVGYPILKIPRTSVLAFGTLDYRADAELQQSWNIENFSSTAIPETTEWMEVEGEILTFPDASFILPLLDSLEEYFPEDLNASEYYRVLVQTLPPQEGAVWIYIAPSGSQLPSNWQLGPRWPADPSFPNRFKLDE